MAKLIDLTGQRFGRLTVLKRDSEDYVYPERYDNPQKRHTAAKWICRCDCGNTVSVLGANLRHGNTQSCGCIWKDNLQGREQKDILKIKLDDFAFEPVRGHTSDAGLDLRTPISFWLYSGEHKKIDTGVHVEIPEGYVGLITSKSKLMAEGITSRGTIDNGYTGSIQAVLYNHGSSAKMFRAGDKITQLVILPCLIPELEYVDELDETERGDNGFGSTGR